MIDYWWKDLKKDVTEFCGGCYLCSLTKISYEGKQAIGIVKPVNAPGQVWQMDILQGFPSVLQHQSVLTLVDMFSTYCLIIPLKSETSLAIAQALENFVIKIFGAPRAFSSDNAPNLSGPPIQKLCKFYGIEHFKTTPY
ncbi:hypothetical protein DC007_14470, partial [Enterococcus faecalis]